VYLKTSSVMRFNCILTVGLQVNTAVILSTIVFCGVTSSSLVDKYLSFSPVDKYLCTGLHGSNFRVCKSAS
jgi:hypothetical protein